MQRAVIIGLRHGNVVLEATRHRFPKGMNNAQRFITALFLVGIKDHSEGYQVIDFIKIEVLLLHLFINTEEMFCPSVYFRF